MCYRLQLVAWMVFCGEIHVLTQLCRKGVFGAKRASTLKHVIAESIPLKTNSIVTGKQWARS
jgi:hypothetical protein